MPNQAEHRDWKWWMRTIVIGRSPRRTAMRIVVLIVVVAVSWRYVIRPIRVEGPSMLPTAKESQVKFLYRLAYLFHEPRRGDVVAIRFTGESILLMKRIVGMPGEKVEFVEGRLHINGQPKNEPYIKRPYTWNFVPDNSQLGPDEYYVVGDNRTMPEENHTKGIARRTKIVGRVLL
jgi:signal peptidase I